MADIHSQFLKQVTFLKVSIMLISISVIAYKDSTKKINYFSLDIKINKTVIDMIKVSFLS